MLQTHQVSFRYPHNNRGVSPISLQIEPGQITLLSGSSGSGKSTLARCLMGLIPHLYNGELRGEVRLHGERTIDLALWQLAQKTGMVFQNPAAQMLAPTVAEEIIFGLENLGLPRAEIQHRLKKYLAKFELTHLQERNPHTLSGGEQQKLALAAIVARQPEALILDEPLSMLDTTAAAALIRDLEAQAAHGKAVAIFEHRQEYLTAVAGLKHINLNGTPPPGLNQPPELKLPPTGRFNLEVERVTVQLGAATPLREFSLSLTSGQLVAIVGRNGVGKTTLLRAIAGLQKHRGEVIIRTPHGDAQPDFGLVFQNPDLQLFNASVRAEILFHQANPDMALYAALLEALGLKKYESTPPLLLSEGEKKRLTLAMVLMRTPGHGILLDEPSLGQDHHHKAILTRLLGKLAAQGQLVVMTTHDLTLAAQADQIVLLGDDGLIAAGATAAVFQDTAAWEKAQIDLPAWFVQNRRGGHL